MSRSRAPRLTHAGLEHLAAIPALTGLSLMETKVSAEDLRKPPAPKLEYLLVGHTYTSGDYFEKGVLEELKNFSCLRSFHSYDGQVSDEDLPLICQIPNVGMRLHLHNQRITDKGLNAFSSCRRMIALSLGGIGNHG